jgi:hypothetical protein
VDALWTGRKRRPDLVDKGDGATSRPGPTVDVAPTEVPLDPSPELTPEKTLDSALDQLLDLRPVTSQARG